MSEFPTYCTGWQNIRNKLLQSGCNYISGIQGKIIARYTIQDLGNAEVERIYYQRKSFSHAGKISHEKALQKSNQEFEKYQEEQKKIDLENSFKEIEEDIKQLKRLRKGGKE